MSARSSGHERTGARPATRTAPRAAAPPDGVLRVDLERLLGDPGRGTRGALVGFRRRPHSYRSTHSLDEVALTWADGTREELLLKGCGVRAARDARGLRPRHCFDPYRELWTYENLLGPLETGAPAFYGTVGLEPGDERLVLEKVAGRPLYEVGSLGVWTAAARRIARLHERGRAIANERSLAAHVLIQEEGLYRRWLTLARRKASRLSRPRAFATLERLREPYERAIEVLERRSRTVLHGELYPSNVLASRVGDEVSIRPVDWEWTAIGPAELDLAAFTAGDWPVRTRRRLVAAYARESGLDPADPGFDLALWSARLVIAVQWSGWAEEWNPPVAHARDWLAEARRAAVRLDDRGRSR